MKTLRTLAIVASLGVLVTGHPAAQTETTPASPSNTAENAPANPAPDAPAQPADQAAAPAAGLGASQPTTEIAVPAAPSPSSEATSAAAVTGSESGSTDQSASSAQSAPAAGSEETYAIDMVHSSVGFRVKHLFSNVTGRFNEFSGTIVGDPAKPEQSKVNVEINVASIDTKDAKRDLHLRSDEFFDVEKFPTIQFTSKKVHRTGQDTAFVTGELTMRGVTKEVILQTKFLGRGKGMTGRIHTGWEARTALKRSDFGLTWNKAIEGTQLVGDDIEIDLQIEAVEPKNEAAAPTVPPRPPERGLPEQDGVVPTDGTPAGVDQQNSGASPSPAIPAAPEAPTSPATPAPAPVPSTPPTPQLPPAPQAPVPAPAPAPGSPAPAPAPSGEQSI